MVSAWCADVQYAITGTIVFDNQHWYKLDIPGDDPDTTGTKEGCAAGETVEFKINDNLADQSAAWVSGSSPRLDLTYFIPTKVYLPLLIR
jgi:hypothetical protein